MSKKDAYVDKLKAQLDEWKAEIDKLEAKARHASADARIKYEDQIKELWEKRGKVKSKLSTLQEVGDDEWEEFKEDIENLGSVVKKEMEQLRSKFS